MLMKTISKFLVAAALLGAGAVAAYAGAADDAIKGRQGCMKSHGGLMGVAVPMIKGEKPFDKAALDAAYAADGAACADWAKWWGADTQKGETVETFAKPEIWTDAKGFEAAGGEFYNAYVALTKATDDASFKAAFPAVGAGCKGCHDKFRRPKP
jgi:cytochrome c556